MPSPEFNRHPALLRVDDTLLVVIDMQEPFLRTIWERDRVVRNVSLLIRACTVLRVPMIATLQYARRLGGPIPEIDRLLPSHCVPLDKLCFSCAADEAFMSDVRSSGRKQILVCGVETHICVCQTALDLRHQGFDVHVASDAVSSRAEANWAIGIRKMEKAGVHLSSAEMALYEMLYEAGTPKFKEIVEMVK